MFVVYVIFFFAYIIATSFRGEGSQNFRGITPGSR